MSMPYDPSWGIPAIALVIGVAGIVSAYLMRRAYDRDYGRGPK